MRDFTQLCDSTKNSSNSRSIVFLRPTGRMPWIILRLWRFLCVRDAGRRGNKIYEKCTKASFIWKKVSRINFSERLYEKNVDPFVQAKSWQQQPRMLWSSRLDQVDQSGQAKVPLRKKDDLSSRETLPMKKSHPARWVNLLPSHHFFSQANGSLRL